MKCKHVMRLIDAYVDGELSQVESGEIVAHTDSCRTCQELIAGASRMNALMRDLDAQDPEVLPLKIRSRLQATASSETKKEIPKMKNTVLKAGMVTVVVAVSVGGLILASPRPAVAAWSGVVKAAAGIRNVKITSTIGPVTQVTFLSKNAMRQEHPDYTVYFNEDGCKVLKKDESIEDCGGGRIPELALRVTEMDASEFDQAPVFQSRDMRYGRSYDLYSVKGFFRGIQKDKTYTLERQGLIWVDPGTNLPVIRENYVKDGSWQLESMERYEYNVRIPTGFFNTPSNR